MYRSFIPFLPHKNKKIKEGCLLPPLRHGSRCMMMMGICIITTKVQVRAHGILQRHHTKRNPRPFMYRSCFPFLTKKKKSQRRMSSSSSSWQQMYDDDGNMYYYNESTGAWDPPSFFRFSQKKKKVKEGCLLPPRLHGSRCMMMMGICIITTKVQVRAHGILQRHHTKRNPRPIIYVQYMYLIE
jgi:hypothetical protein